MGTLSVCPSIKMLPLISFRAKPVLSNTARKPISNCADPEGKEPFSRIRIMMVRASLSTSICPASISAFRSRRSISASNSVSSISICISSVIRSFTSLASDSTASGLPMRRELRSWLVVTCWMVSKGVGCGMPGWNSVATTLVPLGTEVSSICCCTPKASFIDSAICLYLITSSSEKDRIRTKKHISRDMRSAKVAIHKGAPAALSSSSSSLICPCSPAYPGPPDRGRPSACSRSPAGSVPPG